MNEDCPIWKTLHPRRNKTYCFGLKLNKTPHPFENIISVPYSWLS
jgi:hypothetical protein